MRFRKKTASAVLALALLFALAAPAYATATDDALNSALTDTAAYVYSIVRDPQVGSVGGEWAVMSLARSGYEVPVEYYYKYYATLEAYIKACKGNLHDRKYTEYSRVVLALSALGKDPRDVAGYDLLKPLGDYNKTIWQGVNGPIWALISLDSCNYPMPVNEEAEVQATREMYIDRILECQLSDGGFSLLGESSAESASDGVSDPDITGMALQALAKYQDRADVKKVTEEALACMSKMQKQNGGFSSWSNENLEGVVQMIVALTELGIPFDDPKFVKNGVTMLDNLMTFYKPGQGFLHTKDGDGSDQMATEQALYVLVAVNRARDGMPGLYSMSTDSLGLGGAVYTGPKPGEGLEGKHDDVKAMPIKNPGLTFDDVSGDIYHANAPAIEALTARGIITGVTENAFAPDDTMTRAEFAAIVVRGLGLSEKENDKFSDVLPGVWYSGYIGTANTYDIVNGRSDTIFDPGSTITREEAAVMVARAAKLCGLTTEMGAGAARDMLAQFFDYVTVSNWAQESMAFCYSSDILSQKDDEIRPKEPILRCEIAQMIFNMLGEANLL